LFKSRREGFKTLLYESIFVSSEYAFLKLSITVTDKDKKPRRRSVFNQYPSKMNAPADVIKRIIIIIAPILFFFCKLILKIISKYIIPKADTGRIILFHKRVLSRKNIFKITFIREKKTIEEIPRKRRSQIISNFENSELTLYLPKYNRNNPIPKGAVNFNIIPVNNKKDAPVKYRDSKTISFRVIYSLHPLIIKYY